MGRGARRVGTMTQRAAFIPQRQGWRRSALHWMDALAAETLLDDSRRLAEHARKAGVDVRLDVFPEMQHVFHFSAGHAPEADDAIRKLAEWVRPKLGLA
jgi:sugar phosphate isomerase/epimerase